MDQSSKGKEVATTDSKTGASVKGIIRQTWPFFFSILAPVALSPIFLWKPEGFERAPYALYLLILMAMFWVSECIPLAITSFIPVVLCPLFGLVDSDEICGVYFNHLIIFLFGGCMVALSFEYSNLHTRISFFVMKSMGAEPSMLLLGMMGTCMFLSCWMNNTSTTAMMVPVIVAIMDQYKKRLLPTETAEEMTEKYIKTLEKMSTGAILRNEISAVNLVEGEFEVTSRVVAAPAVTEDVSPPLPEETETRTEMGGGDNSESKSSITVDVIMEPKTGELDESTFYNASAKTDVAYWQNFIDSKKEYLRNLELMFLLGVAAASNVGGTGVITGTGTNLIASSKLKTYRDGKLADPRGRWVEGSSPGTKKFVLDAKDSDKCYADHTSLEYWNLDFVSWINLNFLGMLINVIVCWIFLSLYFQGVPPWLKRFWRQTLLRRPVDPKHERMVREMKKASKDIRNTIQTKYKDLGPTSFHEWMVIILFLALVSLWILRNPMFFRGDPVKYKNIYKFGMKSFPMKHIHPECRKAKAYAKLDSSWGWARFFGDECDDEYIHDYVPTMLICFLLMVLPKDPKYYKAIFRGGIGEGFDDPLLPFDFVAKHTPWGPLWMLGGGFAISKAIKKADLETFLSKTLNGNEFLEKLDTYWLLALTLLVVSFLTTIASNTATAVIVSPILIELSRAKGTPPQFLLVPPIVGASYAFILPISTPPNAIVYDKAKMKQTDMMIPGLYMTFLCNAVLFCVSITWTHWYMGVSDYPGYCNYADNKGGPDSRMMYRMMSFVPEDSGGGGPELF